MATVSALLMIMDAENGRQGSGRRAQKSDQAAVHDTGFDGSRGTVRITVAMAERKPITERKPIPCRVRRARRLRQREPGARRIFP
uniref:Uncharacterized protein n=1 Tax=Paracidobacterium acidisoli TaxID=2303751 RepID=A0A372IPD3_9BACT